MTNNDVHSSPFYFTQVVNYAPKRNNKHIASWECSEQQGEQETSDNIRL